MDAVFSIAIAILQQSRFDLLKMDMECMLKYFKNDVRELFDLDHELLFSVAEQVQLNPKRMKKLEKEYLTKRSKEQEEAVELRVSMKKQFKNFILKRLRLLLKLFIRPQH